MSQGSNHSGGSRNTVVQGGSCLAKRFLLDENFR